MILILKKINSPGSEPQQVNWICRLDDDTGTCTECYTDDFEPSPIWIDKSAEDIDQWIKIGNIDGVEYHEAFEVVGIDHKTEVVKVRRINKQNT